MCQHEGNIAKVQDLFFLLFSDFPPKAGFFLSVDDILFNM